MELIRLTEASPELVENVDALLDILHPGHRKMTAEILDEVLSAPGTVVFAAKSDTGRIAGMLSLIRSRCILADKYWIEDVVVDPAFRGQGLGRLLVRKAVEHLRAEGGGRIELTSNPTRTAARNLYQSEGFEKYDTGVFILEVK